MNGFLSRLPVSAAIIDADEHLTIIEHNDLFCDAVGKPGIGLLALCAPEHRHSLEMCVHRAAAGHSEACVFASANGSTILEISCRPLSPDEPMRLVCVFTDVASRELAKEENLRWTARLSELASLSGNTLAVCFQNGMVKHFGSLFPSSQDGIPAAEFSKRLCDSGYLHKDDQTKLADFLASCGKDRHIRVRLRFDNINYTETELSGTVGQDGSFSILFPSGSGSRIGESAVADTVTGVLSILSMESIVRQSLESNPQETHALILIELRNYKQLNESRGRRFGDAVMRDICRGISDTLTGDDFLGRYSGAVLCVFCRGLDDIERAYALGEKIRRSIDDAYGERGAGLNLRCSIGTALTTGPDDNCTDLFRRADVDLFKSNNRQRSRLNIV